jgi:hypothetical protein
VHTLTPGAASSIANIDAVGLHVHKHAWVAHEMFSRVATQQSNKATQLAVMTMKHSIRSTVTKLDALRVHAHTHER